MSYFRSKNWAFETTLPLGISINLPWGGYGYLLELHIVNFVRLSGTLILNKLLVLLLCYLIYENIRGKKKIKLLLSHLQGSSWGEKRSISGVVWKSWRTKVSGPTGDKTDCSYCHCYQVNTIKNI